MADDTSFSEIKPKETTDSPNNSKIKKSKNKLEQAVSFSKYNGTNLTTGNGNIGFKKEKSTEKVMADKGLDKNNRKITKDKFNNTGKLSKESTETNINYTSYSTNNNGKESQIQKEIIQKFKEFSETFINFKKGFFKKVHEIDIKIDQGNISNKKKMDELISQIKPYIPVNINISNIQSNPTNQNATNNKVESYIVEDVDEGTYGRLNNNANSNSNKNTLGNNESSSKKFPDIINLEKFKRENIEVRAKTIQNNEKCAM